MEYEIIKFSGQLPSGRKVEGEVVIHLGYGTGGNYEVCDVKSNGFDYYIAGQLEIDPFEEGYALTGYDGCFELPQVVIDAVKSAGISIEL